MKAEASERRNREKSGARERIDLAKRALRLPPSERIGLVDNILDSLDHPDPSIDSLWAAEVENRLAAYRRGDLKALSLDEVLEKYRKS